MIAIPNNILESAPAVKNAHSRLPGLDIMRTTAILLVVWYHSLPILKPVFQIPYIGTLLKKAIVLSDWIGPLGVDLFFVLSGYLIGAILISIFLKTETFKFSDVRNFWIRRWFRTIPNYYFILTITFLLYHFRYGIDINLAYYFFLQNLTGPHPAFFGEAWSLAVEEWFYLTLPLFLLFISSVSKKQKKQTILRTTFLIYLAIFVVIKCIKAWRHDYTDLDLEMRKVVIYRLDSVMYGVVIAYLMRFHRSFLDHHKTKLFYAGLTGSVLLVSAFFILSEHSSTYRTNGAVRFLIDSFYFTLIPFCFSLLIPAAYFLKDLKPGILKRCIVHLSLISYSVYLVHYALIYLPFFKDLKTTSGLTAVALYLLYWVIVIGISTVNYILFEVPVTKYRDTISKKES